MTNLCLKTTYIVYTAYISYFFLRLGITSKSAKVRSDHKENRALNYNSSTWKNVKIYNDLMKCNRRLPNGSYFQHQKVLYFHIQKLIWLQCVFLSVWYLSFTTCAFYFICVIFRKVNDLLRLSRLRKICFLKGKAIAKF